MSRLPTSRNHMTNLLQDNRQIKADMLLSLWLWSSQVSLVVLESTYAYYCRREQFKGVKGPYPVYLYRGQKIRER